MVTIKVFFSSDKMCLYLFYRCVSVELLLLDWLSARNSLTYIPTNFPVI